MNNFISETFYEQFVISQLTPINPEMTRKHIEWALKEEILEFEAEKKLQEYLQKELEIWQFVKPVVKFIRKYQKMPSKEELQDFINSQITTRTLPNGNTLSAKFSAHIEVLQNKIQNVETNILKELGDIMFFVVAAGSEKINYQSKTIDIGKKLLKSYEPFYPAEQIRSENHNKLLGRYKNGYSVSEDLNRENE